jgi:uncharacterized protein
MRHNGSMEIGPAAKLIVRVIRLAAITYILCSLFIFLRQRSLLFLPSHNAPNSPLTPWRAGTQLLGYCREIASPNAVWLMMHGNAGQAADRDYALFCMSEMDSLYVLEYPGYGTREGSPSRLTMDKAASEAYRILRMRFPNTPVCVLAESIGSGPGCTLAREAPAPEKIVLITPFNALADVAAEKLPFLPVRLLLRDRWNNAESLRGYRGAVDIFAAEDDEVIPVRHARSLAKDVPQARLIEFPGGHNAWAESGRVRIER